MQQCCAAYIVHDCQEYCSALLSRISRQSGVTMLSNIVDNYEQCGQHNIVASCFYQLLPTVLSTCFALTYTVRTI